MSRYEGSLALPVMTNASYPACLSSDPMLPPMTESPIRPVSGDFVQKTTLPPVGTPNPSKSPGVTMSGFDGSKASCLGCDLS